MTIKNPLSISNIAWNVETDDEVAEILGAMGITYIDIAPSKYFRDFFDVKSEDVEGLRKKWESRGIRIYAMQSLLYGCQNLNLFSGLLDRERMLSHLRRVCEISNVLGAQYLTFGSPKNRLIEDQQEEEVQEIALDFFFKLGQVAKENGVTVCIEPNPEAYGANFLTTTREAYQFVKRLDHSNIKLQFDTGTAILNDEGVINDFSIFYLGHVHASTPFLLPINVNNRISVLKKIKGCLPVPEEKVVSIEMLTVNKGDNKQQITEAITALRNPE
ncbi:TIM barrel protein [Parasutterella excrementihominis]|uniref:sugar phosphate isomerase/epimerase family protein n=1 Tax=Parasutterella excrementihominis TaxID=487175 RepID=UPI003517426F